MVPQSVDYCNGCSNFCYTIDSFLVNICYSVDSQFTGMYRSFDSCNQEPGQANVPYIVGRG